ncbi:MAG: HAAS signaling domain-containing protein [Gaiellaceae bacterium]
MSVITDDTPAEVEAYLVAVRATLSDLPPVERDDLLAEVESSLREAADDTGSIGARLGSPEEFAAELRAAAGLHESPTRRAHVRTLRQTFERLAAHPRIAGARRIATELAPVWWVARAYAIVAGIAVLFGGSWSTRYPAVPRFGSAEVGVAVILLAIVGSVTLGLRMRHGRIGARRVALAANLACVLLAAPAVGQLTKSSLTPPVYVSYPLLYPPQGLAYNGAPVQNIYPYSLHGKLLHDVLLYDGAGNPIDIGGGVPDPNRRVLTTSANTSVFNSFPIRYYEPGTVRVAHPNAGPPVKTPTVLPAP